MRKWARYLLLLLLAAYAGYAFYFHHFTGQMLGRPNAQLRPPEHYGLRRSHEVWIPTGTPDSYLHGWYAAPLNAAPLFIYYHDTFSSLTQSLPMLKSMNRAGLGLLAVSYRGYGKSRGKASEESMMEDARNVYQYAADTLAMPSSMVIPFGDRSGGYFAARIAAEKEVSAVVLYDTPKSMEQRLARKFRYLPISLLYGSRFNVMEYLPQVQEPVIIMSSPRALRNFPGTAKEIDRAAAGRRVQVPLSQVPISGSSATKATLALLHLLKKQNMIEQLENAWETLPEELPQSDAPAEEEDDTKTEDEL